MRIKTILTLALSLLSIMFPTVLVADNGAYTLSSGTFKAGRAVGASIVLTGAALSEPNSSLSFTCPITSYSAGTYGISWTCANGEFTVASTDHTLAMAGYISGSMSYGCAGGGRGGHITCEYSFFGRLSGTVTSRGARQMIFGSTSLYESVPGSLYGALGWNSVYSPVVVGDALRPRLLGADDIFGENLVSYGGPGAGVGQFGAVSGLAQDSAGRIYIADSVNNRIDRIDGLTGTDWVELGSTGSGVNHFSDPASVAVDSSGKIWVADAGNNRIVRFDNMSGTNWTSFGTFGTGTNQFNAPDALAFDHQGRVYVADKGNNRLVRFDDLTGKNWATLSEVLIAPYGYFLTSPVGVAVSPGNKVVIALRDGYLLGVDDIAGANGTVSVWDTSLSAISLDKAGTIYVAGSLNTALAQGANVQGAGYDTSNLGDGLLQASAILARPSSSPPPPVAYVSDTIERFGSANIGELSPSRNVYLENTGGQPLPVVSITAGTDFPLLDSCPKTLSSGSYCRLTVRMKPTKSGQINETLAVSTGGVHSFTSTVLSGTGTMPQPIVAPHSLAFDSQKTATTSGNQTVTLTNTGSGALTLSKIVTSPSFLETNNCPALLPAGSGCTVLVSFDPAVVGAASGTLTFYDDAVAAGAQQVVSLTGMGDATAPGLTLAPEGLQFPSQLVNVASIGQVVTLHNGTGRVLTLGTSTLSSTFLGTSNCGKSVASGASCSYTVQFKPLVAGLATGTLTIPIAGAAALVVALSGTGVSVPGTALLKANPEAITFPNIVYGDNPSFQTVVTNSAGIPLGIQSIRLSADPTYSITNNNCPAILVGGAKCTIEVTWVPVSSTPYSTTGALTVIDSTGASLVIPVTGLVTLNGN